MRKVANKFGFAAVIGTLMITGIAGCSMFSPANTPVDCDLVKTQRASGKTDAQIATDLSAKESEVAACSGAVSTGNKSAGMIPQNY